MGKFILDGYHLVNEALAKAWSKEFSMWNPVKLKALKSIK
jgi:hypothetical protein